MAKKISKILKSSGFTLVEILIIIVIIGILAYIGFVVFSGLIKRVGNPQRYAVLSEISGALVRYNIDHNNQYPDSLSKLTAGYLDSLPKDPVTNLSYPYEIGSDFSWAILYSTLDKTALSYTPACSLPPGCQPANFNRTDDYVWGCRTFGNINCGEVNTFPLPPSGSGPSPTPTPTPTSAPTPTPTPTSAPTPTPTPMTCIFDGSNGNIVKGVPVSIYQGGTPSCDPTGNLANGVVGYWKFNESTWDRYNYITDSSGYGYNGQAGYCGLSSYHSSPVSGKFSNSASISGSPNGGGVISIPVYDNSWQTSWVPNTNDFTVSIWANISYDYGSSGFVGSKTNNIYYGSGTFNILSSSGSSLAFNATDANGKAYTLNYNISYFGYWKNIVVTRIGLSNIKLYVNGSLINPSSSSMDPGFNGNLNFVSGSLYLGNIDGGDCPSCNLNFSGQIDDFRIYNRALSQTEVNLLYNGGNGCVP